jgi:MFS superfamily sulfate permease-like transporter
MIQENGQLSGTYLERPPEKLWACFKKYWYKDLTAGFGVSLVAITFALAISIASLCPPMAGIMSAIIAGLVMPIIGGSYVTISGPAAGLAPILAGIILTLGQGDNEVGYRLLLPVICFTGTLQLLLVKQNWIRYFRIIPAAVQEGMLAGIGLMILCKEMPRFLGVSFEAHTPLQYLGELGTKFPDRTHDIFLVGGASLVVIFIADLIMKVIPRLAILPAQVIGAFFGLWFGWYIGINPAACIHIPDKPFSHGFVLPDFIGLFTQPILLLKATVCVFVLTLVDTVESTATTQAIDKKDPYKRTSNTRRMMAGVGTANIISSIFGGLTVIPGGIKSTANILLGGVSQLSNLFCALFLIVYVSFGQSVINMLPLAVLSAVVMFAGYKLAAPKVWIHLTRIGWGQLIVAIITAGVIVYEGDLLEGIAAGVAMEFVLQSIIQLRERLAVNASENENALGFHFTGQLLFNTVDFDDVLRAIPTGTQAVDLYFENVTFIDPTTFERLFVLTETLERDGVNARTHGLDSLYRRSAHRTGMGIRRREQLPSTTVEPAPHSRRWARLLSR